MDGRVKPGHDIGGDEGPRWKRYGARSMATGSYHEVSAEYPPLYIAEAQFRYNNRRNPDIFGLAIAGL